MLILEYMEMGNVGLRGGAIEGQGNQSGKEFKSSEALFLDALNQLLQFESLIDSSEDINYIRDFIGDKDLKSLEDYTGIPRNDLDLEKSGFAYDYNLIVRALVVPNLTLEDFKRQMKKAKRLKDELDLEMTL